METTGICMHPTVPSANFGALQPQTSFDIPANNEFAVGKRKIAFRTVFPDKLEVRHGILLQQKGSRFKAGGGLGLLWQWFRV